MLYEFPGIRFISLELKLSGCAVQPPLMKGLKKKVCFVKDFLKSTLYFFYSIRAQKDNKKEFVKKLEALKTITFHLKSLGKAGY